MRGGQFPLVLAGSIFRVLPAAEGRRHRSASRKSCREASPACSTPSRHWAPCGSRWPRRAEAPGSPLHLIHSTRRNSPTVQLHIFPDDAAMARAVAIRVTKLVAARPRRFWVCPPAVPRCGSTRSCGRCARRGQTRFLAGDDLQPGRVLRSARRPSGKLSQFMEEHLFQHVNLSRRRIHFLNGKAPDAAARMSTLRSRDRARRRHRSADSRHWRERSHRLQRARRRRSADTHLASPEARNAPHRTPISSTAASPLCPKKRCRWGWARSCAPAR